MKKIILLAVAVWCGSFPAFAQKGSGKALRNLPNLEGKVARVAAQKYIPPAVSRGISLLETLGPKTYQKIGPKTLERS